MNITLAQHIILVNLCFCALAQLMLIVNLMTPDDYRKYLPINYEKGLANIILKYALVWVGLFLIIKGD